MNLILETALMKVPRLAPLGCEKRLIHLGHPCIDPEEPLLMIGGLESGAWQAAGPHELRDWHRKMREEDRSLPLVVGLGFEFAHGVYRRVAVLHPKADDIHSTFKCVIWAAGVHFLAVPR